MRRARIFFGLAAKPAWLAGLGLRRSVTGGFRVGLVPQITGLVVFTVVLAGGLISAVMVRQSENTVREQIIANNLGSAELAAEFAYHYIEGTQVSIRLFMQGALIEEAVLNGRFSAVTRDLRGLLQTNKRLDGCSIFDAQGISRATGNTPASKLGNYSGDRDWFHGVIATGKPYLGIPVVSRGTGRPVVPYAIPVLDPDKRIRGVFICGISLAALNNAVAAFRTAPSARASLIDRRKGGIILAHPDSRRILTSISGRNKAVEKLLAGGRGAMETQDSSGQLRLAVYTPVPNLPWGFLILQPSAVAFAPFVEAARQSLLYIAGLLLLLALASGVLARRITRPLAQLRAAASRLAAGDIATRLNLTRQDELGDLGRAFDRMATALAERSAQLRAAHEELQSQYLQVQDANRLKSEFLANMSHELRTPLNAIIGFSQLMHDGKVGLIGRDQKEYLSDILNSADHLLQLINDVLDLAKVESGKIEFRVEPVQLSRLISEVTSILEPLAAGRRLTVEVAVAKDVERIVIDPAKLKQVLYNYLSNAIKFTPEGGHVIVRARSEDADHFRLEVKDTGIGIMPDETQKLFVAFQQLDSGAGKKHQGTGLGLALTKKIVEAQGGRVGVHSTRGYGSIFYAVLPTGAAAEKAEKNVPAPGLTAPAGDDAPNILVIDDNEIDLKWLSRCLNDADYRVTAARSGAEGIIRARSQKYDAILLDLMLPDTGGWDLFRAIRQGPNRHAPVIVVTVVAETSLVRGFLLQDYLLKPARPDVLLEALRGAGVTARGARRRILIVDEDAKILELARGGLEACGYEVACHSSGASALEDADKFEFAAVILDLLISRMDGFEFLRQLRRTEKCRDAAVIVWTSKTLSDAEMERLIRTARMATLSERHGIEAVLNELSRHSRKVTADRKSPTTGTPAPRHEIRE